MPVQSRPRVDFSIIMKMKFIVEFDVDTNQYNIDSEIIDSKKVDVGYLSNQIASLFSEITKSYPRTFYENNIKTRLRLVKQD